MAKKKKKKHKKQSFRNAARRARRARREAGRRDAAEAARLHGRPAPRAPRSSARSSRTKAGRRRRSPPRSPRSARVSRGRVTQPIIRSVGAGAMSRGRSQLALMMIDERDHEGERAPTPAQTTAPAKKPANAGELPPGALENAFERAKARLAMSRASEESRRSATIDRGSGSRERRRASPRRKRDMDDYADIYFVETRNAEPIVVGRTSGGLPVGQSGRPT